MPLNFFCKILISRDFWREPFEHVNERHMIMHKTHCHMSRCRLWRLVNKSKFWRHTDYALCTHRLHWGGKLFWNWVPKLCSRLSTSYLIDVNIYIFVKVYIDSLLQGAKLQQSTTWSQKCLTWSSNDAISHRSWGNCPSLCCLEQVFQAYIAPVYKL